MASKSPKPNKNPAVACLTSSDRVFAALAIRLRFADFLSLRLVCRSWRLLCRRLGRSPPPFPWLMLPPPACPPAASAPARRHFYDIPNSRSYAYPIPAGAVASRHGWLIVAVPPTEQQPRHLLLVNPVTNAQVNVTWPFDLYNMDRFHTALTSSPADKTCFLVVVVDRHLAYCRPGRGDWSKLRVTGYRHDFTASDVVSVGAAVYIVDKGRKMWLVDLAAAQPKAEHVATGFPLAGRRRQCLVESTGQVHLAVSDEQHKSFALFRLDSIARRWVEADGIGDSVLLMGRGCSAAVPAAAAGLRAAGTVLVAHQPSSSPDGSLGCGGGGGFDWFWAESTLGQGLDDRIVMKKTMPHRRGEFAAGDSFWFFPSIDPDDSLQPGSL